MRIVPSVKTIISIMPFWYTIYLKSSIKVLVLNIFLVLLYFISALEKLLLLLQQVICSGWDSVFPLLLKI